MHEDHAAELEVAERRPGGTALVVAAGGDLALAGAAAGMRVIAVDTNPAQIRLLRLKIAAATVAGPERAAAWMSGDARGVLDLLSGEERAWWQVREPTLKRGLCFCGSVDRTLRRLAPLLRWAYDWPDLRAGILRQALRRHGAGVLRAGAIALHGRRIGGRLDATALALLDRRFDRALRREGARTEPLLQVLLGRGFGHCVPPVWTPAGIAMWHAATERLTYAVHSLEEALAQQAPGSLELASASNVLDIAGPTNAGQSLLDLAAVALASGGQLIVRSMLVERAAWHHPAFEPLPLQPDRSPLCPVVWIGRRR